MSKALESLFAACEGTGGDKRVGTGPAKRAF